MKKINNQDYTYYEFENFADLSRYQYDHKAVPLFADLPPNQIVSTYQLENMSKLYNWRYNHNESWKESRIYYYPSLQDFAIHEVMDGLYDNFFHFSGTDYHGAPDLTNFINYNKLGIMLMQTADSSIYASDGSSMFELIDI